LPEQVSLRRNKTCGYVVQACDLNRSSTTALLSLSELLLPALRLTGMAAGNQ
jgi:hypothetical protein